MPSRPKQFKVPIPRTLGWLLIVVLPMFVWFLFTAWLFYIHRIGETAYLWLLALPAMAWLGISLKTMGIKRRLVFLGEMTDAEQHEAIEALRSNRQQSPESQDSRDRGVFSSSNDSLSISTTEIRWESITGIRVFKRDLMFYDLICMEIMHGESVALIDEEMPGFDWVAHELPLHLPNVEPFDYWFQKVAFPPFETSLITIYTKGSRQPEAPVAGQD